MRFLKCTLNGDKQDSNMERLTKHKVFREKMNAQLCHVLDESKRSTMKFFIVSMRVASILCNSTPTIVVFL